eukprot:5146638-Pyramimonas_sp.AAC.1
MFLSLDCDWRGQQAGPRAGQQAARAQPLRAARHAPQGMRGGQHARPPDLLLRCLSATASSTAGSTPASGGPSQRTNQMQEEW